MLTADSGTEPQCDWKDHINWESHRSHQQSNPRPSNFYHSASTNYAPIKIRIVWRSYAEVLHIEFQQYAKIYSENVESPRASHRKHDF
jgi:hypothetical protein